MKKALKIVGWTLVVLLLLLVAAGVAIQSPTLQTAIGRRIAAALQEKTDAQVQIGMISIRPFNAVSLTDVLVLDQTPRVPGADTVARIGSLNMKFTLWGLLSGNAAHISHAKLRDAQLCVVIEPDSLSHNGSFTNVQRILRMPYSDPDKDAPHWGNLASAGLITVDSVRVRLINPVNAARMAARGAAFLPGNIDWNDLDVLAEHAEVRKLRIKDDLITGTVSSLVLQEYGTGLRIDEASARRVTVGKERVKIEQMHLKESLSEVWLDHLQLAGSIGDYGDFIEKIGMDIAVKPGSVVSMQTISHLGPNLFDNFARGRLEGRVTGTVDNLMLEQVTVHELSSGISAEVRGRIQGLPDLENTLLDLQVNRLSLTPQGLSAFLAAWKEGTRVDVRSLACKNDPFTFTGHIKGFLPNFGITGDLGSDFGKVVADLRLRHVVHKDKDIQIDGKVQTLDLNLRRLIGVEALGPLSLKTRLAATLKKSGPEVRIDTLGISRLQALGYDYTGISAVGTYSNNAFDGRIAAADPNLNFLLQGQFSLSPRTKNAAYRFFASLGYADLHALNLDSREQSKVSLDATSNFIRTEQRDLLGEVHLSDIVLESAAGRHNIGDIILQSHSNDNVHRIRVRSSVLEGSFVGGKSIAQMVGDLRSLLIDRDLPALSPEPAPAWDGTSYEVKLKVLQAQHLLDFFVPGMYVADGTALELKVNPSGEVTASGHSALLAYQGKYLKDFHLNMDNREDVLAAGMDFSTLSLGGFQLLGNRISLHANDNHLGLGYSFDNETTDATKAELYLSAELSRDAEGLAITAQAEPSNFYYQGNGWGLTSGPILFKGGDISIDALLARHEDESIRIDGGISPDKADTLTVRMEKFSLAIADTFTGGKPSLDGKATGEALLISPTKPTPGLLAAIVCDSTRIAGQRAGTVRLSSAWNEALARFDIGLVNDLDGRSTVSLDAHLVPKNHLLHAVAKFNEMNLGYAAPFLETLFHRFEGALSGEITAHGRTDQLDRIRLGSKDLHVDRGILALDYTRVPYMVSGDLALDSKALHFTDLRINDGKTGRGRIEGDLLLGGFKTPGTDIHVQFDKMQVLALEKGINPTLFGDITGTGRADVTGPFTKIRLEVDATTGEGNLHLPIGNGTGDRSRELLTFTQPVVELVEDPYEQMMAGNAKLARQQNDLSVLLRVHATPELGVFLDLSNENTLNASGNGTVELNSRVSQGLFSLGGDYTLSQGSFHFSALNLVQRDFQIQEGSTVRFNGEVMDTDLDVHGLYTTKASLANLVSDQDAATNRRTVNCGIHITDKLRNPQVSFSIEVPDLSPSVQAEVESAINTEDKVQKQFIYLLLAGSFLPSEESGITTGGTEMLMSNVSSIMSGQLNNIFEKLNIPLDLGLNYQSTDAGNNLFDVALSTQLFNNRVIVNGSIGNKQYLGGVTTNEVAGDLDIEVKINWKGNLRLNLFSHSADQFSSYLDNSQRNGIGFTYQRDFNTFRQFFQEFFMTPRQRMELEARQALTQPEMVVLQIDTTGHATPVKP